MALRFEHLDLVTVVCTYSSVDGTAANGRVTFTPSTVLVDQQADRVIFPVPLAVDLDNTGSISVQLPATDDPDIVPQGWTYQVTERLNGLGGRSYSIAVPISYAGSQLPLARARQVASSVGQGGDIDGGTVSAPAGGFDGGGP